MHPAFAFKQYVLKRQVLALTGSFRIYNQQGDFLLYSRQKMFKLREDIRVYADESQSQELLWIKARQIIDFSAAYDVIDPLTNEKVGVLRRKGMRSLLRDEWQVLDANDRQFATLIEDNPTRAALRRIIAGALLPQDYDVLINGQRVTDIKQRFNLLRYELDIDFTCDLAGQIDHRLGIAAGILLAAIEGRQD